MTEEASLSTEKTASSQHCPVRRRFLTGVTAALAGTMLLPSTDVLAKSMDHRTLSFQHTHTNERLDVTYFDRGHYNYSALFEVERHLRDHRTGDLHRIDPKLLDILFMISTITGAEDPFHVISGYRSPKTNQMLQHRSSGVAKRSLHMQGRAIDIRVPDVSLNKIRDSALALKQGGVGYYSRSNFIHIDTGRVRNW